ncbi:MAG: hypothetical protein NC398_08210 [Acetatifactor muris]|nr:hypothetical protein [Acetatifactor muris]
MIKRLFRYNRFFSVLFLLSFLVSFLIMYYGLNLNRQLIQVSATKEDAAYKYGYTVTGFFDENIGSHDDIIAESMPGGNIIFRCDGPVGEDVISTNRIDVVWSQGEDIQEPVQYEDHTMTDAAIRGPECIIGDAWEDETYVINGIRYIQVFKIECRVIGEFVTNTFAGEDKRCMVFRDGLSGAQLDKLIFDTGDIHIIYESELADESGMFSKWVRTFLEEESIEETEGADVYQVGGGHFFLQYISL